MSINFVKQFPKVSGPTRFTKGSVGYDLFTPKQICLAPNCHQRVNTGIILEMDDSVFSLIAPKSKIAFQYHVTILGGIIDSDYRGPIEVILHNLGKDTIVFSEGDPIAQLIFLPKITPTLIEVQEIDLNTERGTRGFGNSNK